MPKNSKQTAVVNENLFGAQIDKRPLHAAAAGARSALRELDKAIAMSYSAEFKWHVSEAASRLEQAAEALRLMEQGR